MIVKLAEITRIVIFVHVGQLRNGCIHLVTIHNGDDGFEHALRTWTESGAQCIYDGPPVPPKDLTRMANAILTASEG